MQQLITEIHLKSDSLYYITFDVELYKASSGTK